MVRALPTVLAVPGWAASVLLLLQAKRAQLTEPGANADFSLAAAAVTVGRRPQAVGSGSCSISRSLLGVGLERGRIIPYPALRSQGRTGTAVFVV